MSEIKISSTSELIEFVKDTDLPITQYTDILTAFYGSPIFPLTEDKTELLEFLEDVKNQNLGEFPIFVMKII